MNRKVAVFDYPADMARRAIPTLGNIIDCVKDNIGVLSGG
jgi:hypothetical protein